MYFVMGSIKDVNAGRLNQSREEFAKMWIPRFQENGFTFDEEAAFNAMTVNAKPACEQWKYGSAFGVEGLPFGYIDNNRLADVPLNKEDWLKTFNAYNGNLDKFGRPYPEPKLVPRTAADCIITR